MVLFLATILQVGQPVRLHTQGTDFFSSPQLKKVTPPEKVSKPKPLPKLRIQPKPQPKPKIQEPEIQKSISDVIFLLDTSGSMDALLPDQDQSKLEAAQHALRYFARNMKEGTRFQLWTFHARLTQHPNTVGAKGKKNEVVFEPIGKEDSDVRKLLQKELDKLETLGGTNLYQSVYEAIRYFRGSLYNVPAKTIRRKVVVLLADGQDDGLSPIKLEHVLNAKKRNPEVKIRTIGFGITRQDPLHQILCRMASDSGSCMTVKDAKRLQEIITSFSQDE